MKRLILIRHAKSSWSNGALSDMERPLNARGMAVAARIGVWLSNSGRTPGQVISSTAMRCRQTWEGIAAGLKNPVTPKFDDALYLAEASTMLGMVQGAHADTVLLLGHMPGIGELAHDLRQDPPPHFEPFTKYPTGAVTVLDFRVKEWRALSPGSGILDVYATPDEM